MSREIYLIALMLAGLLLRLWQIDAALWYDEAFSSWLARLPPDRLIAATLGDVHPPGYYLILWSIVKATAATDEITLRLPSLLAGLLLIPTVYALGRRLDAGKKAVWLATGLTALAPFQIYYSQEARPYALLTLTVAVTALALLQRRWWMATGASLAALYLHNLAPIFLFGVWIAGAAFHVSRDMRRLAGHWRTIAACLSMLFAPPSV